MDIEVVPDLVVQMGGCRKLPRNAIPKKKVSHLLELLYLPGTLN